MLIRKTDIQYILHKSEIHLSCFQAYLLKSGFLILMQVNYIAVEIRQHSSDKSNTCTSEPEH